MLRTGIITSNVILRLMVGRGVAVEEVGFSEKSRKSGDRKCPEDWGKSFVELPDAKQFLRIHGERVFQQPPLLSTSLTKSAPSRVFSSFLFLSHTHLRLRSPACFSGRCRAAILEFLSLSNLQDRFVSLHRLGVAHQTSLRSLATMMILFELPDPSREAGSLFTYPVTILPDHW
jgi:hypothetical protein